MDDKEPKTEEAPAQQVTSTDKNTTKSNKDPRRVAAGKKKYLLNTTVEWERKSWRRKEVQSNPTIQRSERSRV